LVLQTVPAPLGQMALRHATKPAVHNAGRTPDLGGGLTTPPLGGEKDDSEWETAMLNRQGRPGQVEGAAGTFSGNRGLSVEEALIFEIGRTASSVA